MKKLTPNTLLSWYLKNGYFLSGGFLVNHWVLGYLKISTMILLINLSSWLHYVHLEQLNPSNISCYFIAVIDFAWIQQKKLVSGHVRFMHFLKNIQELWYLWYIIIYMKMNIYVIWITYPKDKIKRCIAVIQIDNKKKLFLGTDRGSRERVKASDNCSHERFVWSNIKVRKF